MSEKLVILGGGESGIGAARLAVRRGWEVFLSDAGPISADRKATLNDEGIRYEENGHTVEEILSADRVVKSPGIPDKASMIVKLHDNDIPVISEIEFAYEYLPAHAKLIAITGTNGKTTTTLLTHHLIKDSGVSVALGGNIGTSLAGLLADGEHDYYVVEVSSFQLDGIIKFRPNVAVILNITPDHLDRYDYDFSKYVDSKFRITENLTQTDCFIYCQDSEPITEELARRRVEASVFAISASKNEKLQAYLEDEKLIFNFQYLSHSDELEIPVSEISLIGKHNMVNCMAAVLSALSMGVSVKNILAGLRNFKNAPHRLELVGHIRGAAYINDSKATNVDAVYYALDGIKAPIVWVVGGVDKGNDYSQIYDLVRDKVKGIVCLGKNNEPIRKAFGELRKTMVETDSVSACIDEAAQLTDEGDVVLLSPACASFDLFKNYEDRGNQFREAVNRMEELEKERI